MEIHKPPGHLHVRTNLDRLRREALFDVVGKHRHKLMDKGLYWDQRSADARVGGVRGGGRDRHVDARLANET